MKELELKKVRTTLGFTQQKTADILGVNIKTLQKWERKGKTLSPDNILFDMIKKKRPRRSDYSGNERLRIIIQYLTDRRVIKRQKEVCEKTGFNQTVLSLYKNDKRPVSKDLLQKIHVQYPIFSEEWVLNGQGPMLQSAVASPEETPETQLDAETGNPQKVAKPIPPELEGNERVKEAVRYLSERRMIKNQRDFCEKTGIKESVLSMYKKGNRPVRRKTLKNIHGIFPIFSEDWLVMGQGLMLQEEVEAAKQTHTADYAASSNENIATTTPVSGIPLAVPSTADLAPQAQRLALENNSVTHFNRIDAGGVFREATDLIRHFDASQAGYPEGCLLALKEVKNLRLLVPGRDYVIETSEFRVTRQVQLRREGHITAYCNNPEKHPDGTLVYSPFDIAIEDIRSISLVLGYIVNKSEDPMALPK